MKLLGIDDAGRGPVIGPMILAGILIEENQEKLLKDLGAKDSKTLTPLQRGKIKENLIHYPHKTELSTPQEIDVHKNLNTLEAEKAAKIINDLLKNLNEKTKIIIDCPSTNTKAWQNEVQTILTKVYHLPSTIYHLSCLHKADRDHPVVSAASILAKEKREDEIYKLKLKHKVDFGSGYPSDPKTKKFITENYKNEKYKSLIRFSWNTVKKISQSKQKTLF